jgi:hypothetical protein
VSDLIATLITHRPAEFQTHYWAERDGAPYRARVVEPKDVTVPVWHGTELLVVDVAQFELLEQVFGERKGVTLLAGRGSGDEMRCAALYQARKCAAFSRMDDFDSRSALLAILDRYRSGSRRALLDVLSRV